MEEDAYYIVIILAFIIVWLVWYLLLNSFWMSSALTVGSFMFSLLINKLIVWK